MIDSFIFTSEIVPEGYLDKYCDTVSGSILDAVLTQNKHARVTCETLAKTGGMIILSCESNTKA